MHQHLSASVHLLKWHSHKVTFTKTNYTRINTQIDIVIFDRRVLNSTQKMIYYKIAIIDLKTTNKTRSNSIEENVYKTLM